MIVITVSSESSLFYFAKSFSQNIKIIVYICKVIYKEKRFQKYNYNIQGVSE